ncbi:MAG: hypothetical protein AB8B78_06075 [Polaribacter sp.]
MNLEKRIIEKELELRNQKKEYDYEISSLIDSPKCYLEKNLNLNSIERECLNNYPKDFLKGLVFTTKLALDNNWDIKIDFGGDNPKALSKPPKKINWYASHDWKNQKTEIGIRKEF